MNGRPPAAARASLSSIARWLHRPPGIGAAGHRWQDAKAALDTLTRRFCEAVSFDETMPPRFDELHALFLAPGLLVDRTGEAPRIADLAGFIAAQQRGHAAGHVTRCLVTPLSDTTEVFAGIAHRSCIVVRHGLRTQQPFEQRGAIFFQCVEQAGEWRIAAAAWSDHRPGEPLATHPEVDEFGG